MYQLDRKAFLVLSLSFTGAEADSWKGVFVDKFMQQEKELKYWRVARKELKEETKTLHDILDPLSKSLTSQYPDSSKGHRLFLHVHKAINKAAIGSYRGTDRNTLDQSDLEEVERLETCVSAMVEDMTGFNPKGVRWVMLEMLRGDTLRGKHIPM
jgi:hypothetical protein